VLHDRHRLILNAEQSDAGRRLDQYVHERLPQHSRSRIQDWIRSGSVRVDGQIEKPAYLLKGKEILEIEPAEPPPLRAEPESIPLEVLYEDSDVVAINKPAGMVVHAGAGRSSGTLVNALLHRFSSLSMTGGGLRPGIVHRLDLHTSGVLLVARHDAAHRKLAEQFATRTVEKIYLALVHGRVKQNSGRIEKPITRDPVRRTRMTARLSHGRNAVTEYRVLRRFQEFTLLEVRIATGRTHQIRVHLSSAGYAVVGDRLYGAPAKVEGRPRLERHFLHAQRIRFAQPSTGEEIVIEAPLPPELEGWIAGLL